MDKLFQCNVPPPEMEHVVHALMPGPQYYLTLQVGVVSDQLVQITMANHAARKCCSIVADYNCAMNQLNG